MSYRPGYALVLLALTASTQAYDHDWYPASCCGEQDCRVLVETKGETMLGLVKGFELWDGHIIARNRVKPSPDERFHLCETRARRIPCIFARPSAS